MRQSGILLAVSSLPSRHGIGDFGPKAYEFARFLKRSGFKLWQVLPLNPLGYGHSPYQPFSSKAMDELYISLDLLIKKGLLNKVPNFKAKSHHVNYEKVREYKEKYLKKAFNNFIPNRAYQSFLKKNPWVIRYAVFLTLKKQNNLEIWNSWPNEDKHLINKFIIPPQLQKEVDYELFLQYQLRQQWVKLKRYLNRLGIQVVGDIPIYVGIDSEDVWSHQDQFLLDKNGEPTFIAGVPPDYFSPTGQRWGNPLYDWKRMAEDDYAFWVDRLEYNAELYDYIRIDHFRAFDTYYKIPSSSPTAEIGEWILGPAYDFFDKIFSRLPKLAVFAEDLGDLRPEVLILRDHYDFPGMIITQFVFPLHSNSNLTFETTKNAIAMTGSHDNQTTLSWWKNFSPKQKSQIRTYLKNKGIPYHNIAQALVEYTYSLDAKYAIIPLQDLLGLTDKARMNKPGVIDDINWTWRLSSFERLYKKKKDILKALKRYQRT